MVSTSTWLANGSITPFPYPMTPMNNITPATMRDTTTLLRFIESLRYWMENNVVPEFQEIMEKAYTDFVEGIQNAENTIIANKTEWQNLFDAFMADIVIQLEGLNDESMSNLIGQEQTLTRVAIDALIPKNHVAKNELIFNARDFGVTGDGVTDERVALQTAVNAAVGGTLLIPAGVYNLPTSGVFDNPNGVQGFPRYGVRIPGNVSIVGEAGTKFIENVGYSDRRVTFYIEGSNISINNIEIENQYNQINGSRPTSVMIGAGDSYNPDFFGNIDNISIKNCRFIRAWHPIKFVLNGGLNTTATNIVVENCYTNHEKSEPVSGGLSSGGYNFLSKPPGRIQNVSILNCVDEDSSVSAAYGIYGVDGGVVHGNYGRNSGVSGGGIQLENGSKNFVITANRMVDHYNGIWLDDSINCVVSGNIVSNNVARATNRGIRVTWQGYEAESSPIIVGNKISNNVLTNCNISMDLFSTTTGTPTLSDITVVDNTIKLDGTTISYGIYIKEPKECIIDNNIIVGASNTSIRIVGKADTLLTVTKNITSKALAENSSCLEYGPTPTAAPIVTGNRFGNSIAKINSATMTTLGGETQIFTGSGAPGTLAAPIGSLYLRRDNSVGGSPLYSKKTAPDDGWVTVI